MTLYPHYSLQPDTSKEAVGRQCRNDEVVSDLTQIPAHTGPYIYVLLVRGDTVNIITLILQESLKSHPQKRMLFLAM